jgi:hypothetical protein
MEVPVGRSGGLKLNFTKLLESISFAENKI